MNLATWHSIWTVLLVILFVGIVVWAWSSRRQRAFDAAARLPLEDDEDVGSRLSPLIPTPSPSRGEGGETANGSSMTRGPRLDPNGEPSALRATAFTRGEKKHG